MPLLPREIEGEDGRLKLRLGALTRGDGDGVEGRMLGREGCGAEIRGELVIDRRLGLGTDRLGLGADRLGRGADRNVGEGAWA